jgi:hypothetical protein
MYRRIEEFDRRTPGKICQRQGLKNVKIDGNNDKLDIVLGYLRVCGEIRAMIEAHLKRHCRTLASASM